MRLTSTIILLTLLTSCTSRKIPYSEGTGMVTSVNGEVMYQFDPTTKEVKQVISFKQHKNDYYLTFIKQDTLEIGESFVGKIFLHKAGEIHITAPIDTLTSDYNYTLNWTPTTTGEFEFKGDIKFSNRDYSFKWKFVVVQSGQRTNIFKFDEEVTVHNSPFRL